MLYWFIMVELSKEEQAIYQNLVEQNSDLPSTQHQYSDDIEIQRNILGALLTDRSFCIHSTGLVKPEYFVNEAHKMLCKLAMKYFGDHKSLPPKHFMLQEMEDEIGDRNPEIKQYFRTEFNVVYDFYIPGAESREYLLSRITNFAKAHSLKLAFQRSMDLLKKSQDQNTWLNIHKVLMDAMATERNYDIGLDYFQTFEERYARILQKQVDQEIFTSGFSAIDEALVGGGLSRGEMGSWMGLPGTGKSVALVAASLANLHRGKRVLYISLEMDQDKVAERFDSQIVNLSKQYEGIITVNNLTEHKEVIFKSLKDYVREYENQQLLIIKQFPAGSLDVSALRSYITQSKMHGFTPDLLVLDYIGEMKDYPNMPTWESRNKITRDLRGIAVEEDMCILTAMQPDKKARQESKEKEHLGFIDDSNLADAYGQSRPLDALWSINQFQDEKDCGLARIFVAKHRHGKSRFQFHVEFDYRTLRMSQISQEKYDARLKDYRNTKEYVAKLNSEQDLANRKLDKIIGGHALPREVLESMGEE